MNVSKENHRQTDRKKERKKERKKRKESLLVTPLWVWDVDVPVDEVSQGNLCDTMALNTVVVVVTCHSICYVQ